MIKLIIILILIWMSYYDLKYLLVQPKFLIIIAILETFYLLNHQEMEEVILSFLFSFIIFALFSLVYFAFKNSLGGGDVKLIFVLSLMYNFNIFIILFLSSLMGIFYILVSNKRVIPFVPFLTCSVIVFELISCYN